LTDIIHITPLKNPFDNKIGPEILVKFLKVDIPENALVKNGFHFFGHTTKIVIPSIGSSCQNPEISVSTAI
jgi:hypothetical protein